MLLSAKMLILQPDLVVEALDSYRGIPRLGGFSNWLLMLEPLAFEIRLEKCKFKLQYLYDCKYDFPGESIGLKFIPRQSELFRFIPIFVSEPMRIIPNQSEKRFVSRLMKNGQKWIRLNPINFERSIWMNPNQSETKFSIQINPKSDESKQNF